MELFKSWIKEDGPRLQGSRDLDSSKLQSPCIVRLPSGGYRLFYPAVGPAKPYPNCQGYILSAVSEDGLNFQKEPEIRLAPQPKIAHMSLRVISPSVTACADGRWRIYFESRGSADIPTVICSAISADMLNWELETGIRLQAPGGGAAGDATEMCVCSLNESWFPRQCFTWSPRTSVGQVNVRQRANHERPD
jgi:hypothetical protein